MKVIRCVLAILVILAAMISLPSIAQATPPDIHPVDTYVKQVIATNENEYAALNCDQSTTTGDLAQYYRNGLKLNSISWSSSNCNHAPNQGSVSQDGTFFLTDAQSNGHRNLIAQKNGRTKWSTRVTSNTNCYRWGGTTYELSFQAVAVGPDGYIYAILSPGFWPQACADVLVKLHPTTGAVEFRTELSMGPWPGTGIYPVSPRLWAYDDKIVVVDRDGELSEFDFDGNISSTNTYQFTPPQGGGIYELSANPNGTVFASTWAYTGNAPVLYRRDDGTTGSINSRPVPSAYSQPVLRDNDSIAEYGGNTLYLGNLGSGYFDAVIPVIPSGYVSATIVGYAEDSSGSGVMVRNLIDANSKHAVSVDMMDATTQELTNALFLEYNEEGAPAPTVANASIDASIFNGNLYLPICLDLMDCTSSTSVYKIALQDFSVAVKNTPTQNTGDGSREYVALGDSYSSGEGNPDYNPSTTIGDQNECHRSISNGFVNLLNVDENLDLRLVDFVACSAATTGTVKSGGSLDGAWNEAAQVDALTKSTDVVTLTVGGNDVGFKEYAELCVWSHCGPDSVNGFVHDSVLDIIESSAFSTNLQATYETVLNKAENANLYVIDYPYLMDPSETDACYLVADMSGANEIQAALNLAIADAVAAVKAESSDFNNRLHLVKTNETGSPFENTWLCTDVGDTGFNGISIPSVHSLHPNTIGHQAYYELLKGILD